MGKRALRAINDLYSDVYDLVGEFEFYRKHQEECLRELGCSANGIYMDAGCGTGNLLGLAEQGYLIGVDLSAGMLNRAREKGGSDLVNADIEYLPFRDSCLDGIISINVFFQLLRPESFLRDAYGTLKPKGRLVLSTPCIRGLRGSVVHGIYEILRRPSLLLKLRSLIRLLMINKMIFERTSTSIYSIETIVEMLKDEGFEIKRIREAYAGENLLITAKKVKP